MNIKELIKQFRTYPRQGTEKDAPEGSRFIVVSDTLANKIADELEKLLHKKAP